MTHTGNEFCRTMSKNKCRESWIEDGTRVVLRLGVIKVKRSL